MKLSGFITRHREDILKEWESFAAGLGPEGDELSSAELRDHAAEMLNAIAADMEKVQTPDQQAAKSKGEAPSAGRRSAADTHGQLREASGFSLVQLISEFRALRASTLRLWLPQVAEFSHATADEMMRFSEALDQAQAESVRTFDHHSKRTRDTFLAILGHDLRGPLATMRMAGDFLCRGEVGTPDTLRIGKRVRRSASTMTAMVNDLLEFSRAQLGGKMPFKPTPSDLKEITEAAIHDASAAYPDCSFEFDAPDAVPGVFDGERVQQVVTNLLTNAAQHGGGDPAVTVKIISTPQALALDVGNHGPVIAPEALRLIFDPLVQLAPSIESTDRHSTSLGLGLYIAEQIVLTHGGTIDVASDAAKGTVFRFQIPRVPPGTAQ